VELMVFNRWGQRLFITKDPTGAWDGTQNGKPALPDVYAYIIRVQCPDGTPQTLAGEVTLIR